jgi:hypothetical protein
MAYAGLGCFDAATFAHQRINKYGDEWKSVHGFVAAHSHVPQYLLWADVAISLFFLVDLLCRLKTAPAVLGHCRSFMFLVDLLSCAGLLQLSPRYSKFGSMEGGVVRGLSAVRLLKLDRWNGNFISLIIKLAYARRRMFVVVYSWGLCVWLVFSLFYYLAESDTVDKGVAGIYESLGHSVFMALLVMNGEIPVNDFGAQGRAVLCGNIMFGSLLFAMIGMLFMSAFDDATVDTAHQYVTCRHCGAVLKDEDVVECPECTCHRQYRPGRMSLTTQRTAVTDNSVALHSTDDFIDGHLMSLDPRSAEYARYRFFMGERHPGNNRAGGGSLYYQRLYFFVNVSSLFCIFMQSCHFFSDGCVFDNKSGPFKGKEESDIVFDFFIAGIDIFRLEPSKCRSASSRLHFWLFCTACFFAVDCYIRLSMVKYQRKFVLSIYRLLDYAYVLATFAELLDVCHLMGEFSRERVIWLGFVRGLHVLSIDQYTDSFTMIKRVARQNIGFYMKALYISFCYWMMYTVTLHVLLRDETEIGDNDTPHGARYNNFFFALNYSLIHFTGDFPLVEYPLRARIALMLGFMFSNFIQAIPLGLIGQSWSNAKEDERQALQQQYDDAQTGLKRIIQRWRARRQLRILATHAERVGHDAVREREHGKEAQPVLRFIQGKTAAGAAFNATYLFLTTLFLLIIVLDTIPEIELGDAAHCTGTHAEKQECWKDVRVWKTWSAMATGVIQLACVAYFMAWFFLRAIAATQNADDGYKTTTFLSKRKNILRYFSWAITIGDELTISNGGHSVAVLFCKTAVVMNFDDVLNLMKEITVVFESIGQDAWKLMGLIGPVWVIYGMLWFLCEHDPDIGGPLQEKMWSYWTGLYYSSWLTIAGEMVECDYGVPGTLLCMFSLFFTIQLLDLPLGLLFDEFANRVEMRQLKEEAAEHAEEEAALAEEEDGFQKKGLIPGVF